jgi:hypothetical protein
METSDVIDAADRRVLTMEQRRRVQEELAWAARSNSPLWHIEAQVAKILEEG